MTCLIIIEVGLEEGIVICVHSSYTVDLLNCQAWNHWQNLLAKNVLDVFAIQNFTTVPINFFSRHLNGLLREAWHAVLMISGESLVFWFWSWVLDCANIGNFWWLAAPGLNHTGYCKLTFTIQSLTRETLFANPFSKNSYALTCNYKGSLWGHYKIPHFCTN